MDVDDTPCCISPDLGADITSLKTSSFILKDQVPFQVFVSVPGRSTAVVWVSGIVSLKEVAVGLELTEWVDDGLIYAVVGSRAHDSRELVQHVGLVCNSTLHFCIRARGGAGNRIRYLDEWTCSRCRLGGCWSTKTTCFRCGARRHFVGGVPNPQVIPPRERSFPGRPAQEPRPSAPPTTRNPVRKQPAQTSNVAAGLDNSVLLQIMEQLGLSQAVMNEVRGRLQPKPPPVPIKTLAKVVAELEEKERKAATHLKKLGTSVLSRRNALDQAIAKYKVQQADHTRIRTELEEAKARMSETLHAPATGPLIGPQFQDLSENGDSDHDAGDADMEGVVQPEVHQTSEEMFSHVDHEDCVSCGAPSNQIAILPLEGKGSPPPDPKLSDYIPYFKQGKARKVERRDDISKSLMSMVRRMFCRSLLRVRKKKAKKVCLSRKKEKRKVVK